MQKKIIFSIVAIIIVLAVVFLSQLSYFRELGKNSYSWVRGQTEGYFKKASDYTAENVLPKISGEVDRKKDEISGQIDQEKNKISESILDKTKNYFSGITNAVLHPSAGENKTDSADACNCVCPASSNPYQK